jgi:ABC-2 type transport system ATP-binding protein
LLKLLSGLSFPKSGSITAGGFIPGTRQVSFLKDIFFLTEEAWLPPVIPHELINIYAPFYPGFDEGGFFSLLRSFEVGKEQLLTKLSTGQKKKALIAFALSCNTRYLFFDEPTNGLDIPSKATFRSLLAGAWSEERTIIISTHQVRDLQHLIDWAMVLDKGKILLNGSLGAIAERLTFGQSLTAPANGDVLYSVKGELGYVSIRHNHYNDPGNVDIETLFNGLTEVPERLLPILNTITNG